MIICLNINHSRMSLQITQWLWRNRVLVIKVSFSLTSVLVTGLMQFGEWCKGASRNSTRIFGRTIGKQTTFLWHTEFSQWPTSACLSEGRHAVSMSIRTEEESHFRQIQFLTYYRLRNKMNYLLKFAFILQIVDMRSHGFQILIALLVLKNT